MAPTSGRADPISLLADIRYEQEEGIVWRRNRLPTVTVRSDLRGDAQGPDVTARLDPKFDVLRGHCAREDTDYDRIRKTILYVGPLEPDAGGGKVFRHDAAGITGR